MDLNGLKARGLSQYRVVTGMSAQEIAEEIYAHAVLYYDKPYSFDYLKKLAEYNRLLYFINYHCPFSAVS